MAYTNRSMILAMLSGIAAVGLAAYATVSTATYDVICWVLAPLNWLFQPDHRHIELTHPLHATRADDVRRNAPFRSFFERARGLFGFNDHFHSRMIAGT